MGFELVKTSRTSRWRTENADPLEMRRLAACEEEWWPPYAALSALCSDDTLMEIEADKLGYPTAYMCMMAFALRTNAQALCEGATKSWVKLLGAQLISYEEDTIRIWLKEFTATEYRCNRADKMMPKGADKMMPKGVYVDRFDEKDVKDDRNDNYLPKCREIDRRAYRFVPQHHLNVTLFKLNFVLGTGITAR